MDIILASASPRRKKLLQQLGINFKVRPSNIDETKLQEDDPIKLVRKLSHLKATDVNQREEGVIIAADTIVSLKGEIFEKPQNPREAYQMLSKLSGQTHQVITGITVIKGNKTITDYQVSNVVFKELKSNKIKKYIATGEPLDKAGAYAIQGKGAIFVKEIKGCFYNIVGLSLFKLVNILEQLGVEINLDG